MSEPAIIWNITPEDAKAAEADEHAERLAELAQWAARFGDVLATVHEVMRVRLPARMADKVTLEYARMMLEGGRSMYDDAATEAADSSDWQERE